MADSIMSFRGIQALANLTIVEENYGNRTNLPMGMKSPILDVQAHHTRRKGARTGVSWPRTNIAFRKGLTKGALVPP